MSLSVPWRDEALDHPDLSEWKVRRLESPHGWYLEGPCPVCQHMVRDTWLDDIVRGLGTSNIRPARDVVHVPIRCKCSDPASHGENRRGCGRAWTVEISP